MQFVSSFHLALFIVFFPLFHKNFGSLSFKHKINQPPEKPLQLNQLLVITMPTRKLAAPTKNKDTKDHLATIAPVSIKSVCESTPHCEDAVSSDGSEFNAATPHSLCNHHEDNHSVFFAPSQHYYVTSSYARSSDDGPDDPIPFDNDQVEAFAPVCIDTSMPLGMVGPKLCETCHHRTTIPHCQASDIIIFPHNDYDARTSCFQCYLDARRCTFATDDDC